MLQLEYVVELAHTIDIVRAGSSDAQRARTFLNRLDEESLLQLALLADAGDEVIELIRCCDT